MESNTFFKAGCIWCFVEYYLKPMSDLELQVLALQEEGKPKPRPLSPIEVNLIKSETVGRVSEIFGNRYRETYRDKNELGLTKYNYRNVKYYALTR